MTIHKVSYIALALLFFFSSCKKEVEKCNEIFFDWISIYLDDDTYFTPSKCVTQGIEYKQKENINKGNPFWTVIVTIDNNKIKFLFDGRTGKRVSDI